MLDYEEIKIDEEWKEVRLGDIATFKYGKMPKKDKLNTGDYPTFSGYKYQYKFPEFNCLEGDLIIVARGVGGTGDVKIVKEKCYLTNLSIKIDLDNKEMINKYFYYKFLLKNLRYLDSGSAQSQITIGDLERIIIKYPPLPTQKKIAEILSSLDDKIELNNQMNKTLEEMAQAIFKQWFVDFEFPNEDGEPYKSSGGEMIESELGMIPEGWEVIELRNIFKFIKGKKPKETFEKKIENFERYLTIKGYLDEEDIFAKTEKIVKIEKKEIAMVMDGASSGTLFSGKKGVVGSTLSKLENNANFINNDTLYFILKNYESEIKQHLTGSAIPHTDKEFVYRIKIALPKIKNQVKEFSNVREKMMINSEEIKNLTQLRDTLLPKLMNGEIDVTNIEILDRG